MSIKVSVIIPAWNLWDMTLDCLQSLAQYTDMTHVEVIVVDNGSTDSTATELGTAGQALFGTQFQAVRLPHNMGFAKGCNAGVHAARGDFLFFLNNDTLVTQNWLPPLQKALENSPFLGMVGPLLLYPDSHAVQHCGVVAAPTRYVDHLYEYFPPTHPVIQKNRLLQAITGAALLIPTELFHRCGMFHEGYTNGCEDIDLCCSVRQAGKQITCVPQSVIYHKVSQTPGRSSHDDANFDVLKQRWPHGLQPDLHRFAHEDGYIPRLTAALHLCLHVPDAVATSLTQAFTAHFDEARCRARLMAEPLWEKGYILLIRSLEQRTRWEAACHCCTQLTRFFPLPEHFVLLARLAVKASNTELALQAAGHAQKNAPSPEQRVQHIAFVKQLQQHYLHDDLLQGIFMQWLTQYAQ